MRKVPAFASSTMSLQPAPARPECASVLYVDHVTCAVALHVALTYGGLEKRPIPAKGGLAAWQEKRAVEMLTANLEGDVRLRALVQEVGFRSLISRAHSGSQRG
jgi:hypothetical protein